MLNKAKVDKSRRRCCSSPNVHPAVVSVETGAPQPHSEPGSRRSEFSPDGSFEFEELLGGLDDPDVVARQDAGAQEEAHVPVALQLVQAALFTQQAAQLHSWKTALGLAWRSLRSGRKSKHSHSCLDFRARMSIKIGCMEFGFFFAGF